MKQSISVVLVMVMVLNTSCATIVHGGKQKIGITSVPDRANVFVDSILHSQTPTFVNMKRKRDHMVRLEKDGYVPVDRVITREVTGWVWGNILFGGLIGLLVDIVTGGLYDLEPEQIHVILTPEDGGA